MHDIDKLPRNIKAIATGICFLLLFLICTVALFTALFHASLPRHGRVILGEPRIISTQKIGVNFYKNSQTNFAGLDDTGLSVIDRTYLITIDHTSGSGLMLTSDLMVTAAHVFPDGFDDSQPIEVYCLRGENDEMQPVQGHLEAIEPTFDVAFITVQGCVDDDVAPLLLDVAELPQNRQLHMFGFEIEVEQLQPSFIGIHRPTSRIGSVSCDKPICPRQVVAIAGLAEHGNSGGPVFENNGSIVGIIVMIEPVLNQTFMVPASVVQKLLILNGLDYPS